MYGPHIPDRRAVLSRTRRARGGLYRRSRRSYRITLQDDCMGTKASALPANIQHFGHAWFWAFNRS